MYEEHSDEYMDDGHKHQTKKQTQQDPTQNPPKANQIEAELQHNKKYPAVADIYC
jgi:hypothetical protein